MIPFVGFRYTYIGDRMSVPPSPPTNEQKYLYTKPKALLLGFATLGSFAVLLGGSCLLVAKSLIFLPYLIFAASCGIVLIWNVIGLITTNNFDMPIHIERRVNNEYFPSVDVFLPCCGEDLSILENSYGHISKIKYRGELNIYVLDDGKDSEVKTLAEKYKFNYFKRPTPTTDGVKKAGNMRYAFKQTSGELILVLDADFTPRQDFLEETVFYFQDQSIAILQTPHFFETHADAPFIERGSSFLQEIFFRNIQQHQRIVNGVICCGSSALYRRKALEPFGGAANVDRSEDVNTGLNVITLGYRVTYLPLNLSAGLSPDTVRSFFNQHYRWSTGAIQARLSDRLWNDKIDNVTKFGYMFSFFYFATLAMGTFLYNIPSLLNVYFFPESLQFTNYAYAVSFLVMSVLLRLKWTTTVKSLTNLIAGYAAAYVYLVAVIDLLRGELAAWVPTGAASSGSRNYELYKTLLAYIPGSYAIAFITGVFLNLDKIPPYSWVPGAIIIGLNVVVSAIILRATRYD